MEVAKKDKVVKEDDSARSTCAQCGSSFSLFKRKHHCLSCGKWHCADCLDSFSIPNPLVSAPRVCKACYPTYDKEFGAPPKLPALTAGKTRLCVAGYSASLHWVRANNVALLLAQEFPDKFEFWTYGPSRDEFFVWLVGFKEKLPSDATLQAHKTSPICWLEKEDGSLEILGGRDKFVEWIAKNYSGSQADKKGESLVTPFESTLHAPPPHVPVTAGKMRINVAGYGISPNYTRAHNVAFLLKKEFPDQFDPIWSYGPSRDEYFDWLAKWKALIPKDSPYQSHKTAPICWIEKDDGSLEVVGGRDDLCVWTKKMYPGSKADSQGDKMLNPFEQNR